MNTYLRAWQAKQERHYSARKQYLVPMAASSLAPLLHGVSKVLLQIIGN